MKTNDGDKIKICLLPDVPDWAYGHISDQLIARLSESFDFKRVYIEDVCNLAEILLLAEDCDIIHSLWRGLLSTYWNYDVQKRITDLGFTEKEFRDRFLTRKVVSTEVYDHLFLEGAEREITEKLFAREDTIVTHYAVSSQKLKTIYSEMEGLKLKPSASLPDGVDLEQFVPANLNRFSAIGERTICFGWVGNSQWWSVDDLKGIGTIIRPAIDRLVKEGYEGVSRSV